MEVLEGVQNELGHRDIIRIIIRAVVLSPNTNFRSEIGEPDPDNPQRRRLTAHELASALNYAIRDEPPSEELKDAVEAGRLDTVEDIQRELDRLLMNTEQQPGVNRFFRELFGYQAAKDVFKDVQFFPGLDQQALSERQITQSSAYWARGAIYSGNC